MAPRSIPLLLTQISMDKISELPADILSFLLSLLTMKEAARTSILSRRWRHFWKTAVASSVTLNVDVIGANADYYNTTYRGCLSGYFCNCLVGERKCAVWAKRRMFVGYMHQILRLDHVCVKDSFRIRFYLEDNFDHNIDVWIGTAIEQIKDGFHHIDRWIEMAIAKRCQKRTISLSHLVIQTYICCNGDLYYLFPSMSFSRKLGPSEKCMSLERYSVRSFGSIGFISLIDLQLSYILIDGDDIVSILFNCPNLENLYLLDCKGLHVLDISGRALKLRHLTVLFCNGLNKINVHSKNLTRFQYSGLWVEFTSIDVPQLSNVIFRTERENSFRALSYALGKLSSDVPQVESLMLSVVPIEEKKIPKQLPLFTNLKKLVLLVRPRGGKLWGFIPLLQASPYLRRLELHLSDCDPNEGERGLMERPCDLPHLRRLEEIMISGFIGCPHYFEFATYIVNNTTSLKKMTIFPEQLWYEPKTAALNEDSKVEVGKLAAKPRYKCKKTEESVLEQLANLKPPGVELLFA